MSAAPDARESVLLAEILKITDREFAALRGAGVSEDEAGSVVLTALCFALGQNIGKVLRGHPVSLVKRGIMASLPIATAQIVCSASLAAGIKEVISVTFRPEGPSQ